MQQVPQMGCAEAAVDRVLLAPEGLWNSIMTASVCVCFHQMDELGGKACGYLLAMSVCECDPADVCLPSPHFISLEGISSSNLTSRVSLPLLGVRTATFQFLVGVSGNEAGRVGIGDV